MTFSTLTPAWLLHYLTPSERRVLALLSLALSTREIATRCGVSQSTICSHRDSLREKLSLKGTEYSALLALALSNREVLTVFLPPEKMPRK